MGHERKTLNHVMDETSTREAAIFSAARRLPVKDQSKVHLNGRLIHRCDQARQYVGDQDVVSGVEFKAGSNVLVFKVVNKATGWEGPVRFTDAADPPVKGLKVTLTPPLTSITPRKRRLSSTLYFGSTIARPLTWEKCRRLKVATLPPRSSAVAATMTS